MLGAAFLGALVFGRLADVVGRKRVYWLVAAIMVVGAVGSALSPSFWILIAFRFVLGFGVGGDYPVSAVMVSEYANRKDRGKLVGMVFGAQALGLVVGPLIALALLGAGAGDGLAWRVMLGIGAVPAAGGLRAFLTNRRYLVLLAGTAGTWFLLDYAYYRNTISTPQILGLISPGASQLTKIALQLGIFVVAAV
jgi:PHS family inorganic phosphate transporter-like MFS transporter